VTRTFSALTVIALAIAAGCTATTTDDAQPESVLAVEMLPPAEPSQTVAAMAVVDIDGRLAIVDEQGEVSNAWAKWSALVAPDATQAVLTLPPQTARTLTATHVAWASLPDGEAIGDLIIERVVAQGTATSLDGELVALTTLADESTGEAIAGARDGTDILIASRTAGVLYETSLDGNYLAEAFSQRLTADGVPTQVFLLEYLPADDPIYYQVRVLATETGQISPPLNLRDKSQTLDQQMAGYSRSHVVANDHGLLFTLYVGSDSNELHRDAFVHTLDFADGVWCLDIDPKLDLTNVAGSLAVGGNRLYVASTNGWVGSFLIPSITDSDQAPTMDWTMQVEAIGSAPVITADENGVYISSTDDTNEVVHLGPDGTIGRSIEVSGPNPQALESTLTSELVAVGDDWATPTGDLHRPEWLNNIDHVILPV
jgi:hypothetical protein